MTNIKNNSVNSYLKRKYDIAYVNFTLTISF